MGRLVSMVWSSKHSTSIRITQRMKLMGRSLMTIDDISGVATVPRTDCRICSESNGRLSFNSDRNRTHLLPLTTSSKSIGLLTHRRSFPLATGLSLRPV